MERSAAPLLHLCRVVPQLQPRRGQNFWMRRKGFQDQVFAEKLSPSTEIVAWQICWRDEVILQYLNVEIEISLK